MNPERERERRDGILLKPKSREIEEVTEKEGLLRLRSLTHKTAIEIHLMEHNSGLHTQKNAVPTSSLQSLDWTGGLDW